MKLHRYRVVGILQLLKESNLATVDDLIADFADHGVEVGSGNHLNTLLTPLVHLGIVDRIRRHAQASYSITELGKTVLEKTLR